MAVCLVGCATTRDPIDTLVTRLSSSGLWREGPSAIINLPQTASIEQVLDALFHTTPLARGWVSSHKILKIRRQVHVPPNFYTVVLVQTNLGEKIVLLRYERLASQASRWWIRVYDAKTSG